MTSNETEIRKQIERFRDGASNTALLSTMLAKAAIDEGENVEVSDLIADALTAGWTRAMKQVAGTYVPAKYRGLK